MGVVSFANCLLYMDDVKLYCEIITENDSNLLQKDIINIQKWCLDNEMKTNSDKCAVISFSRKSFPMIYNYKINDNNLNRVNIIRDLGITFDAGLNFHEHVNRVVLKINRLWSFIWRNTKYFKSWRTIKTLYLTLIKSVLVYGSPIWRPYTSNKIALLEKIQHRVVRQMSFLAGTLMNKYCHEYSKMNKKFGLPTLESLFKIQDCICMYKIISGKMNCEELKSKFQLNKNKRDYPPGIVKPPFHLPIIRRNYIKNEPINRMSELANELIIKKNVLVDFKLDFNVATKLINDMFIKF